MTPNSQSEPRAVALWWLLRRRKDCWLTVRQRGLVAVVTSSNPTQCASSLRLVLLHIKEEPSNPANTCTHLLPSSFTHSLLSLSPPLRLFSFSLSSSRAYLQLLPCAPSVCLSVLVSVVQKKEARRATPLLPLSLTFCPHLLSCAQLCGKRRTAGIELHRAKPCAVILC